MKKILIAMDTRTVSGPAKNLLAFLEMQTEQEEFVYELVAFQYGTEKSDYIRALEKLRYKLWNIQVPAGLRMTAVTRFLNVVRETKPDIVQTHGYKTNVFAMLARLVHRFKWISFFHGWTNENRKVRVYHFLDRLTLRFADTVVAVAEVQAATLRRMIHTPVVTLANAINVDCVEAIACDPEFRQSVNATADTKVLLCLGRLSKEKGQIFLLEAFEQLDHTVQQYRLVFVGEGVDGEMLQSATKKSKHADLIYFKKFTPTPISVLKASDMLVVPSLSEGMPNVVLEAFAAKVPVVATAVGEVPSLIGNNTCGMLVPSGNPTSLSRAIAASVHGDKTSVERAYELVRNHYSVSIRGEKILKLYAGL